MELVTTLALLFLSIIAQTSCLIEVENYEFKTNEIFRGNHTIHFDNKAIMFSKTNGTIYSSSLSQLPSDIDDLWFDQSKLDNIEDGALCSSPKIRQITFYLNNLPQLTGGTLSNCINLNVLVYDRNRANGPKMFSDDAFAELSKLRSLAISGARNFPHVPKTLFKGLNKLEVFRIYWSNVASVENGAFDDMVNLEIMDLRENELETLDAGLFSKLSKLQELDLSQNKLKQIHDGLLVNLHNLRNLDISQNRLETLPWNDLVGLSQLMRLDFYNNNIKNLMADVDLVETVKTHWPYLDRLEYHQETTSCEELVATTTAIWEFRSYLEMPHTGCNDEWKKHRKLKRAERKQQRQQH